MATHKILMLFFTIILATLCDSEKVPYISTERPHIHYYNKKYVDYLNVTSRRYNRKDPIYYVDIHMRTLKDLNNNILTTIYFAKDIGNDKRQIVMDLQYKFCDFLEKDALMGKPMRQGKFKGPCPYPPDTYDMYNMSIAIDSIPKNFPYFKGRITAKLSHFTTKEVWLIGYIDMEVKDYNIKKGKSN